MNFSTVAALLLAALCAWPSHAQDEIGTEANQFRFERQLRVNPFDPAALNNLAVVKAGQGRYADAYDLLQRAARLAPQSEEIRTNVGRLKAWMDTMGARDPLAEPELTLSQVPPEPPRLWNSAPPKR
ncbi:hypothetical protein DFR24_0269 [Panacagrimonas perspica]|uniref:Tetratricopeptide repeat protein n=1 Tax=Panacagrimonas perspica TaxID=381431 RepID=A0A4S3K2I9_9GAMM|nr:tetratricopeptide repeat protein [Panacagrimonas perspica]TDU30912.1 hypothetical protein DFR24_0269 [Panacagrimonas perspica]THD01934.1 hypothetical protein B1810_18225 [Panacagrimonas perspica]